MSRTRTQANRRTAKIFAMVALGMFGFGFVLWPLYDIICEYTGFLGKTGSEAVAQSELKGGVDTSRTVTVEFLANVSGYAPWEFQPIVRRMQVHPGEFYQTSYLAENLTDRVLSGQAVPSVAPPQASLHFQKIECFCFTQQEFQPGEKKDMPVVFRIDPELSTRVSTVTLSYTFFKLGDNDS